MTFQQREIVYCSRRVGGYHLKVSLIGRLLLTIFNWATQQDQGSAEGNHATLINTDGWIALIRLMGHIYWISVCVMLFILFGFVDGNISVSLDRYIPYHDVVTILSYFIACFFSLIWTTPFGPLVHWQTGKPNLNLLMLFQRGRQILGFEVALWSLYLSVILLGLFVYFFFAFATLQMMFAVCIHIVELCDYVDWT